VLSRKVANISFIVFDLSHSFIKHHTSEHRNDDNGSQCKLKSWMAWDMNKNITKLRRSWERSCGSWIYINMSPLKWLL